MAWFREKALACPGCGLPRDETMNPETEGQWRARDFRCHACVAKERALARFPAAQQGGLYFNVERS